jgi:UDP-glucose 4-epimerase
VDSLIPDSGGNLYNVEPTRDHIQINVSDVRDTPSLRHLVLGKQFLFNLAGQTRHLDSVTNPMPDLEINCQAQLSILLSSSGCRRRTKARSQH